MMKRTPLPALCGLGMAVCSAMTIAETVSYEQVEVGTVLRGEIGLGALRKPIPLPPGEWAVTSKSASDVGLSRPGGKAGGDRGMVQIQHFTLTNTKPTPDNPLVAMAVHFTPSASNINWTNGNCESKNPRVLVDSFGTSASSLTYLCAYMIPANGFSRLVASVSAEGKDKWLFLNFGGLAQKAAELPDRALIIDLNGNQYGGRVAGFTFVLRRDAEFDDPAYARLIKDWTHGAGQSLEKILANDTTSFTLPGTYVATAPQ